MVDGELYRVLGVRRDADAGEIKQAFKRLARSLHPDQNQHDAGAEERFRQVRRAYEVLSDARARAIYDRYGEDGLRRWESGDPAAAAAAGGAGGPGAQAQAGPAAGVGGFRMRDLFGAPGAGATARRGGNLSCTASVDLAEAVRGCVRELRIKGTENAPERVVRVRIPAGVRNGERLRVRGLGRQGSRGGEPGDLWLLVRHRAHPHFVVEGGELHLHLPVSPLEAYDGGEVELPTPYGHVRIRVPPRSHSGTKLRIRRHGIRRGTGTPGDLIIQLRVVLPTEDGLREPYARLDASVSSAGGVRRDLRFE